MARAAPAARRLAPPRRLAAARAGLLAALLLAAGCGYGFTSGAGRLPPGAERIFVPPFDNRSSDAEAGAWVAAAVRQELARRGASGRPGDRARIEGEVETIRFLPAGTTFVLTLAVRARLAVDGKPVAELPLARNEEYVAGQDPLETEGRRRLALRRAAEALGRDLVEKLERP
ncbi:LPS assembly lipoprotein LptE [Anaeromyxobacter paludicola]|uniref:LPS-assembly lipoprotein LptE n=1 Tax=Anaeromyxobacter paludicola TaxID=2918171 RepID=A0ABN6N7Z2_9BACT|nr:LPS assembly lipoprotein LptE [Anaeromyxobacter paludicola]BDG08283.1 hypothetical protein AMPC_13960 [Anaeromyxobacter paludicola]